VQRIRVKRVSLTPALDKERRQRGKMRIDKKFFGSATSIAIVLMLAVSLSSCATSQSASSVLSDQQTVFDCQFSPPVKLEGAITLDTCCKPPYTCMPAEAAAHRYTEAAIIDPSEFRISLHASPWHLYDRETRIVDLEELAKVVKPRLRDGVKRIVLAVSWSQVPPNTSTKSIAQRLSDLLDGFPVTGMDGFIWLSKNGTIRTTRQAVTFINKCPYKVHEGDEIMVSVAAGWFVAFQDDFIKKGDAEGIMHAGAAWEIYMLCLDRALRLYEMAAKLSNPIAAYNAAIIRLERGADGDIEEAARLFKQAAALGDKKAQGRLDNMVHKDQ
jgi:hypothetical protein